MKRRTLLTWLIGLILWGCSFPQQTGKMPPATPLPYHFSLTLTSQLPNPYYVVSGPMEAYRRFPFTAWTQQALNTRLAALSGRTGQGTVGVAVTLVSLTTGYSEIGLGPRHGTVLYAGIGRLPLLGDGDMDWGEDGRTIPSEIHKSAELRATLTLRREGQVIARKDLTEKVATVVYWKDYDAWSYDYEGVLKAVIAKLTNDVQKTLEENFGSR